MYARRFTVITHVLMKNYKCTECNWHAWVYLFTIAQLARLFETPYWTCKSGGLVKHLISIFWQTQDLCLLKMQLATALICNSVINTNNFIEKQLTEKYGDKNHDRDPSSLRLQTAECNNYINSLGTINFIQCAKKNNLKAVSGYTITWLLKYPYGPIPLRPNRVIYSPSLYLITSKLYGKKTHTHKSAFISVTILWFNGLLVTHHQNLLEKCSPLV